jgi:arylsulfatase A-like enzyme
MSAKRKPHIIIFNPDQWRGDVVGHLGNPAAVTPNLDKLVENDAVSFSSAYCQLPVCTPSRCSFMTGWYPHVRGHRTMGHMLQPDEPALLRQLKEAGYFVWWGGKNDLVPAQNGFSDYCDVKYHPPADREIEASPLDSDDWRGTPDSDTFYSHYYGKIDKAPGAPYAYDHDWAMIEGAVEQIRQRPADQPLCIYLPLLFPHPPYAVEDPWHSLIDRDKLPDPVPVPDWSGKPSILPQIYHNMNMQTWSPERWRELRATYYGMCARVDHQFGMIIDALREAGIYDDTAIFFFSDHGDFTGDYGLVEKTQNTFEDCLIHVPFVFKPPKDIPCRPRISDALVELVDFYATAADVAGLTPSHTHFGRSLLPITAGETDTHRRAVFCEGGRLDQEMHTRELEAPQHREFLYWPRLSVQVSDDRAHTRATMIRTQRYKYVRRLYEQDELYDLEVDPQELHNRIDDPALAAIRAELVEQMLTHLQATADVVPFKRDAREAPHYIAR